MTGRQVDVGGSQTSIQQVYAQGVAVTKDVIAGVRLGRATGLKRVKRAVQMIVDQVLNNEISMVGLTTIREYDEYTFTHSMNVCIFSVALGKKLGFSRPSCAIWAWLRCSMMSARRESRRRF